MEQESRLSLSLNVELSLEPTSMNSYRKTVNLGMVLVLGSPFYLFSPVSSNRNTDTYEWVAHIHRIRKKKILRTKFIAPQASFYSSISSVILADIFIPFILEKEFLLTPDLRKLFDKRRKRKLR